MREALYWEAAADKHVRCGLCPHKCLIAENASGICGARMNKKGVLEASGYGMVSSIALDPIEKKPLYMFNPGKNVLSIGGYGCNLKCPFCQNYEISAVFGANAKDRLSPEEAVAIARQAVPKGNIGLAYTYNEPLIGYEFLIDCAKLIREAGLMNVIVTNGYINEGPLDDLLPLVDAMNIDLKGFTENYYRKLGGSPEAVKKTIVRSYKNCHIEITNLIVPGENENDVAEMAKWLSSVDPGIPLHLTRFFPRYKYSGREPTPKETIKALCDIAGKHLRYVFAGNMR